MKFVIQRVLQGSVKVSDKIVGEIGPGLVVLVGFTHTDKKEHLKFAANKLLSLRLWDSAEGVRWKECVKDRKYGLLIVSQFTLYSYLKGNKPDYHNAMDPTQAIALYNDFLSILKQIYIPEKVQAGLFGEMMQVSLVNDGPVTINWEYPELPEKQASANKDNNKNEIPENDKNAKQNNNNNPKKESNQATNKNNDTNKKFNNKTFNSNSKNTKKNIQNIKKESEQELNNFSENVDKMDLNNINNNNNTDNKENKFSTEKKISNEENYSNLIKLPD